MITVPSSRIESLLPLFGLPTGASRLSVHLVDESSLLVISHYRHIIRPANINYLKEAFYTSTDTRLTQSFPVNIATYRDIKCMLEGVQ